MLCDKQCNTLGQWSQAYRAKGRECSGFGHCRFSALYAILVQDREILCQHGSHFPPEQYTCCGKQFLNCSSRIQRVNDAGRGSNSRARKLISQLRWTAAFRASCDYLNVRSRPTTEIKEKSHHNLVGGSVEAKLLRGLPGWQFNRQSFGPRISPSLGQRLFKPIELPPRLPSLLWLETDRKLFRFENLAEY